MPSAGKRAADCAAAEVQEVAHQVGWPYPPAGPASAVGPAAARVPRAIRAAEAAAVAAEAAAQATMASQALLAEVQSRTPRTPVKRRGQKEPASSTKHAAGNADAECSAFPAQVVSKKDSEPAEADAQGEAAQQQMACPATAKRKAYSPRGTAGTYQGKRPPKDPERLAQFMKAKAAYDKEKQELRKTTRGPKHRRPTAVQEEYRAWQRTFNRAAAVSSRARLTQAAAEWQTEKARVTAEKHKV